MAPIGQYGVEAEFFGITRRDAASLIRQMGYAANAEEYNHDDAPYWKLVSDSTVSREGNELVSPILRMGDGADNQTTDILSKLRNAGGDVDRTCGLHIHHDAHGMTPSELAATIGIYALWQPIINSILPSSRHDGEYCRGLDREHAKWAENSAMQCSDLFERYNSFSSDRYLAINTQAIRAHGTIEFRQHSGTLNPKKVMHWKRFTKAMMEVGKRANYHSLVNPYGSWDSAQDSWTLESMLQFLKMPFDTVDFYMRRQGLLVQSVADYQDDGEDMKCNGEVEPNYSDDEDDTCYVCGYSLDNCTCEPEDDGGW